MSSSQGHLMTRHRKRIRLRPLATLLRLPGGHAARPLDRAVDSKASFFARAMPGPVQGDGAQPEPPQGSLAEEVAQQIGTVFNRPHLPRLSPTPGLWPPRAGAGATQALTGLML